MQVIILLTTTFAWGCASDSRFPESSVTGVIQYNGKPLLDGTITFISQDRSTSSAQAEILNGNYSVRVPHGSKRVEIHSSKWTGKPYEEFGIKEMIQFLPENYNEKSTLTAQIGPQKKLQLNFELQGPSG